MSNLGIYRPEFEKAIVIFEIITLEFFHGQSFMQVLWVFLGLNLKKSAIFLINTLKFVFLQSYVQKKKKKELKFGISNSKFCICIFGLVFQNAIVIFEVSTLKIV